jgi:hypothetical protein
LGELDSLGTSMISGSCAGRGSGDAVSRPRLEFEGPMWGRVWLSSDPESISREYVSSSISEGNLV